MLTIKRQIPAQQPSLEVISKMIQQGKENGSSSERIAGEVFLEFNKPSSYETEILQIGQQVKIVDGMKYDIPKPGTICKVVRIEYQEDDSDYIEVQIKCQGQDDYKFQVSANPQDVSEFIELI